MADSRLDQLMLALDDGGLTNEQRVELETLLKEDVDARRAYVEARLVEAVLYHEAGLSVAPSKNQHSTASPARRKKFSMRLWPVLLASLVCAVVGRWLFLEMTPTIPESAFGFDKPIEGVIEPTATGIALVTRLVDVTTSKDSQPLQAGDLVSPGRLAIDSGLAQVEFFCGATVVLEGPAALELKSADQARVLYGQLRANVPPAARGFSLLVDDMTVVDLGTEFALSVDEHAADVVVFDGEVELHNGNVTPRRLVEGDSVRRNEDGVLVASRVDRDVFASLEELDQRQRDASNSRLDDWRQASQSLASDERLIAYYNFEDDYPRDRRLESALLPSQPSLDGAIVGAKPSTGRWAGKQALEFKHPGDRVRVQIPGQYDSLTFACWVRIDSLDRQYNSLFLTDSYDQGEPHWQILEGGQLFFSIRPRPIGVIVHAEHHEVVSPAFWTPDMSGRWLHLATSYNTETSEVVHFLNGERLHSDIIPEVSRPPMTQFGTASIGNWSDPTLPDAAFAIRNLNGRIDELAIFGVALHDAEVKELFNAGKP